MKVEELPTPALVVDADVLGRNISRMSAARPGRALRPHVKAFKSTALARELEAAGHPAFCAATVRELVGMVEAGLGDDLLLANQSLDRRRLGELAEIAARRGARVTVAVDSEETVDAAAASGIREVLIDVDVGCYRCGCPPEAAGPLADLARRRGLGVRGVMGYEGHLMMDPDETREERVEAAMALLLTAAAEVDGDVVSGGGTGTFAENRWVTELQAGSYTLMDGSYASRGLPFEQALALELTVLSVNPRGWAVADGGLKALAMDAGDPTIPGFEVLYCSDEHTTFLLPPDSTLRPGDRVRMLPAHVDPTVAKHEALHVVRGNEVVDSWPIDLRGW